MRTQAAAAAVQASCAGRCAKKHTQHLRRTYKMKLKPLNDRVLVKRLESEEVTSGGIIIPDSAKEKPQKGKVVAAGPGKLDDAGKLVKMAVKAGDVVLFTKYAGTEIKIEGDEHLVLREDDILAIVEK
jgi:chaperonin GroES